MADEKENIQELIDEDEGLRSKRKLLTITSLILLALQFSGAKVVKANTFILELNFSHQDGIALLLLIAIIFLSIRYYNYARPYHEKLYKLWTDRMMSEGFYFLIDPYNDYHTGLIIDFLPNGIDIQRFAHEEHCDWWYSFKCKWFFRRYLVYEWYDENPDYYSEVDLFKRLSFRKYLKVLKYELKHQIFSFFTHRENLDIMSPYLLAALAISSYFLSEKIQYVMTFL